MFGDYFQPLPIIRPRKFKRYQSPIGVVLMPARGWGEGWTAISFPEATARVTRRSGGHLRDNWYTNLPLLGLHMKRFNEF